MSHKGRKNLVIGIVVAALLCVSLTVFAQQVSAKRHPNLAAAQDFVLQAIGKIDDAQKANNYDMKGHAEKAKQLMKEAMAEIQQAEQAADAK